MVKSFDFTLLELHVLEQYVALIRTSKNVCGRQVGWSEGSMIRAYCQTSTGYTGLRPAMRHWVYSRVLEDRLHRVLCTGTGTTATDLTQRQFKFLTGWHIEVG